MSKSYIDGVLQTEIDTTIEGIIILHDTTFFNRQFHYVGSSTARWMIDLISKGEIDCNVTKYDKNKPLHNLISRCPCAIGDTTKQCEVMFNVNDVLVKIESNKYSELNERMKTIAWIKNREAYKRENNMTDCLRCRNTEKLRGLGKRLQPFKIFGLKIYTCQDCSLEYCSPCKAIINVRQRIDHRKYTCYEYCQIKGRLGETNHIQCPACKAEVSKVDGCNHMVCRCGTHFCYKCGVELDGDRSIHKHYYSVGSKCNKFGS